MEQGGEARRDERMHHAQRPEFDEEIEITEEMIAMGAAELDELPLLDLAEGWYSKERAAIAVYRAMRKAAPVRA
jgi:hypothetical protein